MGFRLITPKRVRKIKSEGAQKVLERLDEFLKSTDVTETPVEILCRFWEDQQTAITYQELREAVKAGHVNDAIFRQWTQDYAHLVKTQLNDLWRKAMGAGAAKQPLVEAIAGGFVFNMQTPGILSWLNEKGAEFVTACTRQQKDAIAALLSKKMIEGHTVDELARMIRPCIGLTKEQAKANARYYDNVAAALKEKFPTMRPKTIQKRAQEAAGKYAERQHRARAMTIAQTESAFAYNRGADEGIRQAQAQKLIGTVRKRWSTSGDDGVCDVCAALEEAGEVDMDSEFTFRGETLFVGHHLLPPAHPRCACAVEYIEIEPPVLGNIPEMKVDITRADSFREYSTEEIEEMAKQTEEIVAKHLSIPSKWSGKMVVSDEGIQNSDGSTVRYGKLWNCDIATKHETAPAIILHEQIHARSISYYESQMYEKYNNIEEASVQLLAKKICEKERIEVIPSGYDNIIEALGEIGKRINVNRTEYEFAKDLLQIPVMERLGWLSDNMYAILGSDPTATLEEYQKFSELLDMLY
ncbi:MAG: phage head morphogenesis protein [Lachnospiraceae bacterium]|nr:phage head morphogenesis protein [Lachnospiraceae bacterium]